MSDVVAHGVRFHVQRLGPRDGGRHVVFLHGLVMDNLASFYFTLANPLARFTDVILYDLRGHGRSERPPSGYTLADMVNDLAAILDALAIGAPVALVGNSFGGLLALAFASTHPERVERVVLIDGHLGEDGWSAKMAATLELEGEARDQQIATSFQSWLGRHSERKSTRLAETAASLVYGTSLVRDMRASSTLTDDQVRAVRCPVLALYGELSDLRPPAERIVGLLPHAELRIYPGSSHSILWEATARVRTEVVAWIANDEAT